MVDPDTQCLEEQLEDVLLALEAILFGPFKIALTIRMEMSVCLFTGKRGFRLNWQSNTISENRIHRS